MVPSRKGCWPGPRDEFGRPSGHFISSCHCSCCKRVSGGSPRTGQDACPNHRRHLLENPVRFTSQAASCGMDALPTRPYRPHAPPVPPALCSRRTEETVVPRTRGAGRPLLKMEGRRFGSLTVLAPAGGHGSSGCLLWQCRCDCGVTTAEDGSSLRKGQVLSCGCTGRRGPPPRPGGRRRKVIPWAASVARMRAEGMTLAAIGAVVGRSRERVRQVLAERAERGAG